MKATRGKANPQQVNDILRRKSDRVTQRYEQVERSRRSSSIELGNVDGSSPR